MDQIRDTIMKNDKDVCEYKRCQRNYVLTYTDKNGLKRRVCMMHWEMYCEHKIDLRDTAVYRQRKRVYE